MNLRDKVKHFHIDNGGYTFEITECGNLVIEYDFFGYCPTTIGFSQFNYEHLIELGEFLIYEGNKLKEEEGEYDESKS